MDESILSTTHADSTMAEASSPKATIADTSLRQTTKTATSAVDTKAEETSDSYPGNHETTAGTQSTLVESTPQDTTLIQTSVGETTLMESPETSVPSLPGVNIMTQNTGTLPTTSPQDYLTWESWSEWTDCYFKTRFERFRIKLCAISEVEARRGSTTTCTRYLQANLSSQKFILGSTFCFYQFYLALLLICDFILFL